MKGGKDDYFSSDYTDEELYQRLSHISSDFCLPQRFPSRNERQHHHLHRKVLVAWSGQDEYVPSHVDGELLLQRLVVAMQKRPCANQQQQQQQQHHNLPSTYNDNHENNINQDYSHNDATVTTACETNNPSPHTTMQSLYLKGSNHNLSNTGMEQFIDAVVSLLTK
jgi:hypothetical protein